MIGYYLIVAGVMLLGAAAFLFIEGRENMNKMMSQQNKIFERALNENEKLKKEIHKMKRQINCVKDHPEIKPLNCCWAADSLVLRELKKEIDINDKKTKKTTNR